MTDKKVSHEDLVKIKDLKLNAEQVLQNAKLEIENANLKFQNAILNVHLKYGISIDENFNLETGEINKKEKKDAE